MVLVLSGVVLTGCASSTSAPVAAAPAPPPPPALDTKVAWILRLEQQRVLRDVDLPAPTPPETPATPPAAASPVAVPAPADGFAHAMVPDLTALAADPEAVVRARAALAIGRVGRAAGGPVLVTALADPELTVRENAAFALGLLAARDAVAPLQQALADTALTVRARAIEALGLIGAREAAPWILQAASGCGPLLAPIEPDDEAWPKTPEIEVCRQALYALVRLQDFAALAAVALDAEGRPVSSWWPVAYALQRSGDRGAIPALRTLSGSPGVYTAGFALRGLAALQDTESAPRARTLLASRDADVKLRVAALRLLARVGTPDDATAIVGVLGQEPWASPLGLEAIAALGTLARPDTFDVLLDGFGDRDPMVRAASLAAAARVNPDAFLLALSGLPRDPDWRVRAALATALGAFPAATIGAALGDLAADEDARVHGPALRALAVVKAPDLADRLAAALEAPDFGERAAAADLLGQLRAPGGVARLAAAYERGAGDSAYAARLSAIEAIAAHGGADAIAAIRPALADPEWPIRVRAAALLRELGVPDAEPERPAPPRRPADFFQSDALLRAPYTPRAFVETSRGVIELQLDLVAAPLTSATFVDQVRSGLFNGLHVHRLVPAFVIQTGDPRGDGEGGPGYTQRDELSPTPYLRGTVGMALGGPETGGSQWFITTSPQPHLDARYTAFGRVVGGWDVLDRLSAGDLIERVRIWDGIELR